MVEQLCECCGQWVNQMDLVWDLEEDRLVCLTCQKSKNQTEIQMIKTCGDCIYTRRVRKKVFCEVNGQRTDFKWEACKDFKGYETYDHKKRGE